MRLCEYCSEIYFEYLRNPTVDSLQRLNEGHEVYGKYPFRYDTSEKTHPRWCLGRQQRIDTSAATCPFCRAIIHVMDSSNVRGLKSVLFDDNPVCQANIYWSAALKPPLGMRWKLPADVRKGRTESCLFYLRRPSLKWYSFNEFDEPIRPGPVDKTIDVLPHSWAVLSECFQTFDTETHMATEDLFHEV